MPTKWLIVTPIIGLVMLLVQYLALCAITPYWMDEHLRLFGISLSMSAYATQMVTAAVLGTGIFWLILVRPWFPNDESWENVSRENQVTLSWAVGVLLALLVLVILKFFVVEYPIESLFLFGVLDFCAILGVAIRIATRLGDGKSLAST